MRNRSSASRPRKTLPEHELRTPMHKIRTKNIIQFWLARDFPGKSGRVIEDALLQVHKPDLKALERDYYERR